LISSQNHSCSVVLVFTGDTAVFINLVNRFTVFTIFVFKFSIMLISRQIVDFLKTRIAKGKILVITGPRQVGKTTLAREVTNQLNLPTKYFNGDLPNF